MDQLLSRIKADFPEIRLRKAEVFSWSPQNQTVTYKTADTPINQWSLLHEVGHGLLNHKTYRTDFELLLLEVAAWEKAKQLAADYALSIDDDHIQDCIDTYRDWLYQRSTCPTCGNTSLQQDSVTYKCFNCSTVWTVTASRFCRPYRLTSKQAKTPLMAPENLETTFLLRRKD